LPDSQIAVGNIKNGSLKGLKFAVPEELLTDAIQPGIRAIFETAVSQLEAEGVSVARVKMPSILYGVTTYYIIAPAEASSNLARFDGIRFGPLIEGDGHIDNVAKTRGQLFGHEVKSRIMIGTYALSAGYYDAYYVRAQQVRGMMSQEFEEMFQTYDAVLNPTSPVVAFKLGALTHDPLALKALDLCTIPSNMGGFPSISINAGFDNQLPVGIQLTAPAMADETLLQMAYSVEQALPAARWTAPMK
jgi:aspartyl-tRNA(Asn)/glutamyl-tRNA(Gln) amidotransferase subunit A